MTPLKIPKKINKTSKKLKNFKTLEIKEQNIILDSIPALVYFKGKENEFLQVNKAFANFLGKKKEELEGKSLFDLYSKEEADNAFKEDKEVMTSGKPKIMIVESINVKEKTRFLQTEKIPYRDKKGAIIGIVGFSVDMTDRRRMEEDLKDSEIRFRRLFETAQDGIFILNADTAQIDEVNPYLIKMLGYSHEEFLKKKLWEVGAFMDIKKSKKAFELTQKSGYVTYEDMPLQTKDGRLIKVEFVSNLYKVGLHKVIQCNIRDITDRKNLELLQDATKLLEEEKKKIEFIAEINHEFRTPLAIIKGNVDLMLMEARKKIYNKTESKERKNANESIRNIDKEVKYLSELIADLTLLTITNSGIHNVIINSKVNLTKLINRTIKRWSVVALQKNISIRTKLANVTMVGDEKYLERLLINIIKNAILYSKKGGWILIGVSNKKNEVEISVKDNGIGMSAEEIPNIFNRFYRTEKSHKSDTKSVGLGLAITKWVVEAHGGKILATSPGLSHGSTFTVTFPINK